VRGGGGCRAGVSIPHPRPRPRTKNQNFPHTRTQLNRLFSVKFGAGAAESDGDGFVAMSSLLKSEHIQEQIHIHI